MIWQIAHVQSVVIQVRKKQKQEDTSTKKEILISINATIEVRDATYITS